MLAQADPMASFNPGFSGIAVTVIVLGVLFAAAWLLRRGTFALPGRKRPLGFSIETAFSLGERRSLAVVTVEGRRLLLGLTPTNISLISELPPGAQFGEALDRRVGEGAQP
jgi:flagellar protein FliO/FliZ